MNEITERLVHNGAMKALTKKELPCNAFCKPPVHCDLWYSQEEDDSIMSFQRTFWSEGYFEVLVVGAELAREAPPEIPAHYYGPDKTPNKPVRPWLIYWMNINGQKTSI